MRIESTIRMWDAVPQTEVCVWACMEHFKTDKQITLWASGASKQSNTHKMAGLESIHLNAVRLKWIRMVERKSDVSIYIVLKWQTGGWAVNVNKRTKRKEKITHSS